MGELKPGDVVFDEQGKPCNVVATIGPFWPKAVYKVCFDDGEMIRADAGHEWLTETLAARQSAGRKANRQPPNMPQLARPQTRVLPAIVTTEEIFATLTSRKDNTSNHVVRNCAALYLPDVDLPVPPYVMGVWLGDGTRGSGSFTSADAQVVDEVRACGYTVTKFASAKYAYNAHGLIKHLRTAGVLTEKFIPSAYLRASAAQRLALLQGLMDTDGTALPSGACEFYSTSRRLMDNFRELLVSLGLKGQISTGRATLNGKDCGEKYRIKFTTSRPVFRLCRKLARQKQKECGRTQHRTIVDVQLTETEYVKCITVDSPSHLFLAGYSMVPTHNSYWGRGAIIRRCLKYPGTNHLLLRRTYREVNTNHKADIKRLCRKWGVKFRFDSTDNYFEFTHYTFEGEPSRLYLGYAQTLTDAERYIGIEWLTIWHEECNLQEEAVVDLINNELVVPPHVRHLGAVGKYLYTCNPTGIGKRWTYERVKRPGERGDAGFVWIYSNWEDNIPFRQANPNFAKGIRERNAKTPWIAEALLEGNWDVDPDRFYVFDETPGGKNVVELKIPGFAEFFAGVDYGYWPSAFAVIYFAKWQDKGYSDARGDYHIGKMHWYAFGEIQEWQKEPPEQAVIALDYEKQLHFPPPPYSSRGADAATRAKVPKASDEASSTVGEMWDRAGWETYPAAKGFKKTGLGIMRWLLKEGIFQIHPRCQGLIGELGAAQYEKLPDGRPGPNTDPKQPDDMQDAARYITSEQWASYYETVSRGAFDEDYEEAA